MLLRDSLISVKGFVTLLESLRATMYENNILISIEIENAGASSGK